ncbi:Small RNA 2'-O-methyltransferase [Homalodisca vitripennis]|nr:Small RNA 2'-O-methyltransferase [Homalodisca vitripennis]
MIISFHLVVYFAYRFWDNYISVLFNNDDNDSNTNQNPGITSSSSPLNSGRIETDPVTVSSTNKSNQNTADQNETSGNDPDRARQAREGDGDLQVTKEDILIEVEDESCSTLNSEPSFVCKQSEEGGMTFIPPVYTQRYMVVENILKKPCWAENVKKVVDFGCAELNFESRHLKKLYGIEEIIAVDVNESELSYYSCKVGPSPVDYLSPRPSPLTVRVYCGSVAHTHQALNNCDAVIAIELIEHLYPGDLDDLPFTIFGYIRPKIAMFTTPNADFNVLFPNFSGFRHYDHKFEWSRQQFEDWCNNLVLRYPDYSVAFQGVGPGPTGTEHLGCCSQMATFIKVYNSPPCEENELHIQDGEYILVREYEHPFHVDKRTLEEKLRDEAVNFINRYCILSKQFDEERLSEIPLKTIMERIKCLQREKLKKVLAKDNWEIKTNSDGYEVVILPDSENEDEEELFPDDNEDPPENGYCCDVDCDNTLTDEANWDCDKIESKVDTNISTNGNSICLLPHDYESVSESNNASVSSINNTQIGQTISSDNLDLSFEEKMCSKQETIVPGESVVVNTYESSDKEDIVEKDMDLDCSVYETPYNVRTFIKKSDCELFNPSNQSLYHEDSDSSDVCRKALSFMTPSCKDCDLNNSDPLSDSANGCGRTDSFCCISNVSSPLDISTYATPCCSHLHRKSIPKCLSLQQISAQEAEGSLRENGFIGEQKDKVSKSMEGFKTQESCDMHETCSNASKVVDSGYPDSYSEHNMDMDLTPEQFDDIETESEGNDVSSRSLSPPPPPPVPQILRLVDDVQNGDVANNNRDGEGNNVVADMEEELLEFEAQIEEVNNELPNLAAVDYAVDQDLQLCHRESNSPVLKQDSSDKSCNSSEVGIEQNVLLCSSEAQQSPNCEVLENKVLLPKNKALTVSLDTSFNSALDKPVVKSTESNTSIATHCSWGHLDSSESPSLNSYFHNGINDPDNPQNSCNLKQHSSLTTVLDGCSKFSNCSLVQPIEKHDMSVEIILQSNPNESFSQSKTHFVDVPESTRENFDEDMTRENAPQQDCLSIRSEYESAASLHSVDNDESSSFPRWLLDMQVTESDEHEVASINSVMTVWDVDSYDELVNLNYDVQVDTRGGGDPQRDSWD